MTPMIPTPGDYRTAGGVRVTINRIGRSGKFANGPDGRFHTETGEHCRNPALDIVGPWVSEPESKAIECWVNDYADNNRAAHWAKHTAEIFAGNNCRRPAVHMIEASELARVQTERDEAVALLRDIARNMFSPVLDAFLAKIGKGNG